VVARDLRILTLPSDYAFLRAFTGNASEFTPLYPFGWHDDSAFFKRRAAMGSICTGFPIHAQPRRLDGTLASLVAHGGTTTMLLSLDGPEGAAPSALVVLDLK
jgi:hypothetical protein